MKLFYIMIALSSGLLTAFLIFKLNCRSITKKMQLLRKNRKEYIAIKKRIVKIEQELMEKAKKAKGK